MAALGLIASAVARARSFGDAAPACRAALYAAPRTRALCQLQQQARCVGTSARGQLPEDGPAAGHLAALPFAVTRVQAAAAFESWHRHTWLQRSAAQPAKEVFVPFWLGDASVDVVITSAEVGKEELVQRYDRRTGRYDSRFETVWRRVDLSGIRWQAHHAPESLEMQLPATWKYARADMDALRPGPSISAARSITPNMLQAGPGAPSDTRRVAAFTVTPDVGRKLLKQRVEAAERRRAEREVLQAVGGAYQHVRFVQMELTWLGPAHGGPRLSPVYLPLYVFNWRHGGIKVRTFVSGVDARVAGAHHLDDQRIAVLATLAMGGVLLFTGAAGALSPIQLFVATLLLPFAVSTFVARAWPALRHLWQAAAGRLQAAWHSRGNAGEADWSADFVGRYERPARGQQQQQQQRAQRGDAESFAEFLRDPWGWVERELRRQQAAQQAQQRQRGSSAGDEHQDPFGFYEQARRQQQQWQRQQQGQQQQWQQQWRQRGRGGDERFGGGAAAGPPGDPKGYYRRLGVPASASQEQISDAFRALALKHHPDRASDADKPAATNRFQELTEAYQVLRNPAKRRAYDAGPTL